MPELDHAPAIDDSHAVAELRGLGEVMGHEQRGRLALAQHAAELAGRRGPRARVQRRQRLVEQQDLRPSGQRAGDRHALALAAAERVRARVGALRQPEALEQRDGTRAPLATCGRPRSGYATFCQALRCGNSA